MWEDFLALENILVQQRASAGNFLEDEVEKEILKKRNESRV